MAEQNKDKASSPKQAPKQSSSAIPQESFSQNQPLAGMVSDANINLEGLSPSEYSFALNSRLNAYNKNGLTLGELGALSNDMGNLSISTLPAGYGLLNSVNLTGTNNEFCLFLYNPITKYSQIGILDDAKNYSSLIDTNTCLNFSDKFPIKSISSLYKSNDRIVFWTDNNTKPKYINLDSLDNFKDSSGNWICDAFNNQRTVSKIPKISLNKLVPYGGLLKYGTYMFFVRFVDNNNNFTNWLTSSNQIPVVNSPASSYESITGAYNSSSEIDRYGLIPSNNSLEINIDDIQINEFSYYQLGVLEFLGGNGVATNAYVLKKRSITSSTETFTYTGNITLIESITVENEFTIPSVKIDKAASIATIDNRLIYGNTSNKSYDWGKFQIAANSVNVDYVITKVNATNIEDNSTKNPKHYDISRSLMRDEVYALGIVFYMNDVQTPVFHINGRKKNIYSANYGNVTNSTNTNGTGNTPPAINNWDGDVINNRDGNSFGPDAERWQVYNTAIKDNALVGSVSEDNQTIVASGKLAYYETNNVTYPNTEDLNGNLIYPNTNNVMDKIRHHRMPDTNLEQHAQHYKDNDDNDTQYIYPLGLSFSNINFPAEYIDEITGYSFVIGNKFSDNDYTILDKGLMTQAFYTRLKTKPSIFSIKLPISKGLFVSSSIPFTLGNGFKATLNSENSKSYNDSNLGLDTPQSKFNNQKLNFDYVKVECLLNTGTDGLEYLQTDKNYFRASAFLKHFERFPKSYNGDLNLKIQNTEFISYGTASNSVNLGRAWNNLRKNAFQGNRQSAMFAQVDENQNSPFQSIVNLYGHVGDEGYTANNFSIYGYYVSLKNNITDLHANLEALQYRKFSSIKSTSDTTQLNVIAFNGDSFITKWDVRRSLQNPTSEEYIWQMTTLDEENTTYKDVDKKLHGYISTNMSFYVESRINTEYRNIGINDHETYYSNYRAILSPIYHTDGNLNVADVEDFVIQEDYQKYNIDYSNLNDIYPYFPISDEFDARYYTNDLKYRIWYTERYVNGDIKDNRLRVLANSFTELDIGTADQNGITDVFIYNDNLYAHTSKTMFALSTSPQQLKTNVNTIYVGEGDFFSMPPKAINTVIYGYAGSSHFTHKKITEHGVLFVDSNRSKVFLFNNKMEELSSKKQEAFFKYNLNATLINSWKKVLPDLKYPFNNASQSKLFVGYVPFYDKLYTRLFLTKKDFEFNVPFSGLLSNLSTLLQIRHIENELFYDDINDKFIAVTITKDLASETEVDFSNSDYFINKCYTMSFSLHTGLWTSYHSFMPNHVLEDNTTFYSWIADNVITDNKIWVHEDEYDGTNVDSCSYYGNKYPHMIEFTIIQGSKDTINQQIFNSVNYISAAHYNASTGYDRLLNNKTFNEFYVYNSYQHSGLLDLKVYDKKTSPYESIKFDNTRSLVYNDNLNSWNINSFRDISTEDINLDIHTDIWSEKSKYYNGTQGFIDKVPTNVDYSKDIYSRRRFKDRFLRLRLIYNYNNDLDTTSDAYDDIRLTTNIVLTNTSNTKLK